MFLIKKSFSFTFHDTIEGIGKVSLQYCVDCLVRAFNSIQLVMSGEATHVLVLGVIIN